MRMVMAVALLLAAACGGGDPAGTAKSTSAVGAPEAPADDAGACGPATCPNGCCRGDGACQPGTNDSACGSGGAACESCAQSAQPYAPMFCLPTYGLGDAGRPEPIGGRCCAQGSGC